MIRFIILSALSGNSRFSQSTKSSFTEYGNRSIVYPAPISLRARMPHEVSTEVPRHLSPGSPALHSRSPEYALLPILRSHAIVVQASMFSVPCAAPNHGRASLSINRPIQDSSDANWESRSRSRRTRAFFVIIATGIAVPEKYFEALARDFELTFNRLVAVDISGEHDDVRLPGFLPKFLFEKRSGIFLHHDFCFKIKTGGKPKILMRRTGVTIDATMFASAVQD